MGIEWNKEQKLVIDTRKRNILVSAAAGSGKTAVLSERIITRILDKDDPVDIDSILVLTFTNAAAGEMRTRIEKKISEALENDPGNAHLQKQSTLIHSAHISTIHSFCSFCIQNYFHTIDFDPAFRIMDEGEEKLLLADTMSELLEEEYAKEDGELDALSLAYSRSKDDRKIEKIIMELFNKAESAPWPEKWLAFCRDKWTKGDFSWLSGLEKEAELELSAAKNVLHALLGISEGVNGPSVYVPALLSDIELTEKILKTNGFDEKRNAFQNAVFMRAPSKKCDCDGELREYVKNTRKATIDSVKKIGQDYFFADSAGIKRQMEFCAPYAEKICSLCLAFIEKYTAKKREKNLCSFSDLEHLALDILVKQDEDGNPVRTEAARELQERFREVMCDEYQDSNEIQELILWSVSREDAPCGNRFMVGDIKQSIYGFRMARPDIFLGKYNEYEKEDNTSLKVDLSSNYRSRDEVLSFTNYIFERIMVPELGGIIYNDAQALHTGAEYPSDEENEFIPEILLFDRNDEDFDGKKDKETMIETEALVTALRIRELMGTMTVYDRENKCKRPLAFRDIAILLRSVDTWAEIFVSVLTSEGIPAYAASKKGYFTSAEVSLVLDYLKILDNPYQDIPLAAVLMSEIGQMTAEEISKVRICLKDSSLYEALLEFREAEKAKGIYGKADTFLSCYEELRAQVPLLKVSELIGLIYDRTGCRRFLSAGPSGRQKKANLDMLISKAVDFEKTSYHGLFSFVRYINEIKDVDIDSGEVNVFSESADTVRIVTIHKSKGLEYPVVFLCGTGKQFNDTDQREAMVIDKDLGIGINAVNLEKKTISDSTMKKYIVREMKKKNRAEEQRVLYVAMTRAKEKLIITGSAKNLFGIGEEIMGRGIPKKGILPYVNVLKSSSYLEYILMALYGHPAFTVLYENGGPDEDGKYPKAKIKVMAVPSIENEEAKGFIETGKNLYELSALDTDKTYSDETERRIKDIDSFSYAFKEDAFLPEKLSVSELKKTAFIPDSDDEDGSRLYKEEIPVPYIPAFISEERKENFGSLSGTAFHEVMKNLNYKGLSTDVSDYEEAEKFVSCEIERQRKENLISKEQAEMVRIRDVAHFLMSDIGKRVMRADKCGVLWREQPFMMSIPASALSQGWNSEKNVIVQGIIDAFFIEDGELVLLDYKTDRVKSAGGQELVDKYSIQLYYYEEALEKSIKKPVKEKLIYSTSLGRCIKL